MWRNSTGTPTRLILDLTTLFCPTFKLQTDPYFVMPQSFALHAIAAESWVEGCFALH